MGNHGNAFLSFGSTCILNNFYDHSGDVRNSFFLLASDDHRRVALQINTGHAGIGDGVHVVKVIMGRFGTTSGNWYIRHRRSDDTIVNEYSADATELTESAYVLYTKTMVTISCEDIEVDDRISVEYEGTATATAFLALGTANASQPANTKMQGWNGSIWSDLSGAATGMLTVDGT